MDSNPLGFIARGLPAASLLAACVCVAGSLCAGSALSPREHGRAIQVDMSHSFKDILPAVHTVPVQEEDSTQDAAWAQLVAAFQLVKAAEEMLAEAQSLRSIAEIVADQARSERGIEPQRGDDAAGQESVDNAQSRGALAEVELAFAGKVLETAQFHAQHALAAFNLAWANLLRSTPNAARPDPDPSLIRSSVGSHPRKMAG
jgi:hypothetical protein